MIRAVDDNDDHDCGAICGLNDWKGKPKYLEEEWRLLGCYAVWLL
jgi:hypothetical protein